MKELSTIKRALLARKVRSSSNAAQILAGEPIAVIGMGCRFPGGADDPDKYWDLIAEGRDAVGEVPASRWPADALYDPDPTVSGKMNSRWSGLLEQVDHFDAGFFGIAPREASAMDPQQRVLLEVTWEALERAGQTNDGLAGSPVGVFTGVCTSDYGRLSFADRDSIQPYTISGTTPSILAGRISYLLDLRGPSVVVDTACSSSLVALHLACQSLRGGESDLALAGGVNLILAPEMTISLSQWGVLAADGRCKPFDARANGFVRGEGCGVVVLKRLSDALAQDDPIAGVLLGTSVNQDGHSAGLTAPNLLAQRDLFLRTLDEARVEPSEVSYVETHGTGTELGDPIEFEALASVYGAPRPDGRSCALGSVKANIGHLEAAAGMAGLIKAIQCLRKAQVPPLVHYESLNPHISLAGTSFSIPTELEEWPEGYDRRVATVSSFGFSGTNAHVILEPAPARKDPEESRPSSGVHVLPISAPSAEGLEATAAQMAAFLRSGDDLPDLYNVCFTATQRRTHHAMRAAAVGATACDLASQFESLATGGRRAGLRQGKSPAGRRRKVAFVFSGQGSQRAGMGQELFDRGGAFAETLQRCDERMGVHTGWSVCEELFADEDRSRLARTEVSQPALFALQVALAAHWREWGVEPDAVIGHSVGEIAAAHVSGALSLDDAIRVVCERGRLMQKAHGQGRMVSVELSEPEARALVADAGGAVAVAAINGPASTVLSGDAAVLETMVDALSARDVGSRWVRVEYAFHSPQMDPHRIDLERCLSALAPSAARVPFYSTITGEPVPGEALIGSYWGRNMREPVRFQDGVKRLCADGIDAFLEVGGHPVLAQGISDCLSDSDASLPVVLACLRRGRPDLETIAEAAAGLHCAGVAVAWDQIIGSGRCVDLPTYPWQRKRHWLDAPRSTDAPVGSLVGHPLLGRRFDSALAKGGCIYEVELGGTQHDYLRDHRVDGAAWLPAAAYAEIALASVRERAPGRPRLAKLSLEQPVLVPEGGTRALQVALTATSDTQPDTFDVQFFTRGAGGETWQRHAEGVLRFDEAGAQTVPPEDLQDLLRSCSEVADIDEFYAALAATGLEYGPAFRGLKQLHRGDREALGRIGLAHTDTGDYGVHPALLDAAFQVMAATFVGARSGASTYLPAELIDVRMSKPMPRELWAHARLIEGEPGGSDELCAEVRLLDDAGESVMEVGCLRARRLGEAAGQATWQDWLYRLDWSAASPARRVADPERGTWVLLGEASEQRRQLAAQLIERGQDVLPVEFGAAYERTTEGYRIDPTRPEDHQQLLRDAFSNGRPACRGVVHFCDGSVEDLDLAQRRGSESVLHLVQALSQIGWRDVPRLWLITRGAQAVEAGETVPGLAQAPVWGLGKVVGLEHPELRCSRVDLDPATNDGVDGLIEELLADTREDEIALRGGERYVHRLATAPAPSAASEALPARPAGADAFRLEIDAPGVLDDVVLREVERPAPGPDEVEIEVRAAGLNFKDVLLALGVVPSPFEGSTPLGGECAGVVTAVGSDVQGLHAGQEVVAIAPGCFGRYIVAPAVYTVAKPSCLSFAEAASIPLVFMTAQYALN
ncbi:MAG: beta-ketoacyl synthase N-terminal-like domain-containing protein, partial [Candidatus Binatia bacterium]|nr:beta-ketoacyl synthase N-terminal-like domain-containing protein [Candidatus Binatia bacterium]